MVDQALQRQILLISQNFMNTLKSQFKFGYEMKY